MVNTSSAIHNMSGWYRPRSHSTSSAVDAGDRRLELSSQGGAVQTSGSRLSGGIVIKREPMVTDEWLAALGEALVAEARRSETTRQALERLLTQ